MKTCTYCNQEKPFEDFHKDASRKDGYRHACKKCISAYMVENYKKNKERVKAKVYEWIENNRERHNAKCAKWVQNNRGKVNARTARRYAAKTGATPNWLDADDKWMINEAYALAKLRTQMLGVPFEVDHIVPLRGKKVMGLHVPWNLQIVEQRANRKKSNTFEVVV
jgi:hypothetical protein